MIEQSKPRPGTAEAEIEGRNLSVKLFIQFCSITVIVESAVKYSFVLKGILTSRKHKRK